MKLKMLRIGGILLLVAALVVGSTEVAVAQVALVCDSAGLVKEIFFTGESVYCQGSGLPANTLVHIYVVNDVTWSHGMPIPNDVSSDGVNSVNTTNRGSVLPTLIWPTVAPHHIGTYDAVIDVDRDKIFDLGLDAVDSMVVTGFFIVSELSTMVLLGAGLACLGGYLVLRRRQKSTAKT